MGWGEDEGTEVGRAELSACLFLKDYRGLTHVPSPPPEDVLMS